MWVWLASGLGWVLFVALAFSYRHRAAIHPESRGQGFPLDDAWIHSQFALNVAGGQPFQYEPGVYSSGSTAPLWSLIEGVGLAIVGDVVTVAHTLGVLFTLAMVFTSVVLMRRLGHEGTALLAIPLLLAAQWRLVWASLSGMEVALASFLVILCCLEYLRERTSDGPAWRSAVVAGLLLWTRPEGLFIGLIMALDQLVLLFRSPGEASTWRRRVRRPVGFAMTWLAVIVPLFCINASIGPGIFPQTVYTKAHAVTLERGWELLWTFFIQLQVDHITWHLFFVGAFVFAALRLVLARKAEMLIVVFVFAFIGSIAFFRGSADHYERYLTPCLPVLVVLGADGLCRAARALALGRTGLIGASLALVVTASSTVLEGGDTYALNVASVSGHVVTMGRWVDRHIPHEATLAMSDVGAMSYFTENPVIDMRGLVSPYFGWDRLGELDRQRREHVEYALLFPELNERVILRGRYVPIHVITLNANNISATDNLVVYRAPWADQRELIEVGRAFDFEDGTLQDWHASGSLSHGQVEGAGPGQRRVVNLGGGRYYLSSWGSGGDRDRGRAISPELQIEGDLMMLRIGGGQLLGEVGARLWVDGRIVQTAVGAQSEVLVQREWDLRELQGRVARIELFDESTNGWGHVMLDEVRQYRVVDGESPNLRGFAASGPREPESSRMLAEARGLPSAP